MAYRVRSDSGSDASRSASSCRAWSASVRAPSVFPWPARAALRQDPDLRLLFTPDCLLGIGGNRFQQTDGFVEPPAVDVQACEEHAAAGLEGHTAHPLSVIDTLAQRRLAGTQLTVKAVQQSEIRPCLDTRGIRALVYPECGRTRKLRAGFGGIARFICALAERAIEQREQYPLAARVEVGGGTAKMFVSGRSISKPGIDHAEPDPDLVFLARSVAERTGEQLSSLRIVAEVVARSRQVHRQPRDVVVEVPFACDRERAIQLALRVGVPAAVAVVRGSDLRREDLEVAVTELSKDGESVLDRTKAGVRVEPVFDALAPAFASISAALGSSPSD